MAASSNSTTLPDDNFEPLHTRRDIVRDRFIHYRAMSTDQIVQCGYDAMAIVALCAVAARNLSEVGPNNTLAGDIAIALDLSGELIARLHDTVEMHEGVLGDALSEHREKPVAA